MVWDGRKLAIDRPRVVHWSLSVDDRQKARIEMVAIDIKRELARGGVAGLFKKVGLLPRCIEWSRGFGANFRGAWEALPHPEVMTFLAIALGVKPESVVKASAGCVRLVMGEFDHRPSPVADAILHTVERSMADAARAPYQPLLSAAQEGSRYMRSAQEAGERSEDILAVAAATNLAQAGMVIACPCGQLHGDDLDRAVDACLQMVTNARIAHAEEMGWLAEYEGMEAKEKWARRLTADGLRSQLPFEMVTAPKLVSVPGVTPEGKLVWSQRRGQA